MRTTITADRLIAPEETIENPIVVIEDGLIAGIASRAQTEVPTGQRLDFAGCTLVPAYFDVHIHGSAGHDVMEGTPEAFTAVGQFLARHGVGAYLATTVTMSMDATLKSLAAMAKLIGSGEFGARPLGIHIEGPFLSPHKKGAHPARLLQTPSVELFDRMWEASEGKIRLMTIAPELENALEVIRRAASLGVRVSLGHSNADAAAAKAGVSAGATTATHTYNAMRNFDHKASGLVGEVLTNDDLFAELVCDGFHVDPAAVKMYWRCKGPERAMLITDAMVAAGMPDGKYKLGELDVIVKDGKCVIDENTLAGSTLTLDRGVKNFVAFTGAPIDEVSRLASRNPARMTGFANEVGSLLPGRAADITVLDAKNGVVETILRGECRKN
ncbi:MAG TPA: N-acetylglucosamine-6-phosphate deacetylase [Alloacidobacterium sp.]|nr:N-acetylglucosamine-6-phosphate deacetylase [Alloacidobacterium sp.]